VCAHAVSVAIQKIDGVASVEVSLKGGFADVKLKPGNRVDPERIRQVARDNGFTPKGAAVKVAGEVVERGGKPALAVAGLDLVYLLVEHSEAKGKLAGVAPGKNVVVTAHLPETATAPPPDAPRTLELRDFTLETK
jgi:copper chaperone CopZ